MPIFEFECADCGLVFEVIYDTGENPPLCLDCGSSDVKKLIGAPAFHVKGGSASATPRIEKKVKDYLKYGKFAEATRFADKAASMVKSDKVKRIANKLHEKTGK